MLVEDGVVAWIGDQAPEDGASGATTVIELEGALVLPAFVDAHVHVTETGLLLDGVDLSTARSVREVLDAVAATAARRPGRPVLGHGWDELSLADRRAPTLAELDLAAGGLEVYLSRVDVHSAVVSGRLAARAGLRDLPGWDASGRVEREAHHAARAATRDAIPAAERRELHRTALRAAAAAGIGQVHEMSAPHVAPQADLAQLVRLAGDPAERLPAVIPYRGELMTDVADAASMAERLDLRPGELAGAAGDLVVDGSVGSRTASFHADYADAPGQRGHLYLRPEQVRDHVVACTAAGLQAGFHVIGDAAVAAVLQGFTAAADRIGTAAVRAARHRLEHVEAVTARDIAILAALGLTASVQPAFDAAWGGDHGMYRTRLGPERAAALNPFASLAAWQVPLALGSDAPVTPFDPWGAIRACLLHHRPSHRLNLEQAVQAHTVGGWHAARRPGGTLAAGKPATFAVWAARDGGIASDPGSGVPGLLSGLATGERPARCLRTVLNGRTIHIAG